MLIDQLAVVLVRGHHVGVITLGGRALGQSAYHVIGLIALHLDHRDAVGFEDTLDIRHRRGDIFRLLVAVGFVVGEFLVAECRT